MDIKKILNFSQIKNNSVIFIIILIGAMLMLFSGSGEKKEINTSSAPDEIQFNDEERLCEILSQINDVGSVSVMITYYSGIESDIAYDTNSTISRRGDGDKTSDTEENTDKEAVMSSGEPFVKRHLYPDVKGVVVAAEGADDISVRQQIQEAVTTVFSIAPHKVCVVEKKPE